VQASLGVFCRDVQSHMRDAQERKQQHLDQVSSKVGCASPGRKPQPLLWLPRLWQMLDLYRGPTPANLNENTSHYPGTNPNQAPIPRCPQSGLFQGYLTLRPSQQDASIVAWPAGPSDRRSQHKGALKQACLLCCCRTGKSVCRRVNDADVCDEDAVWHHEQRIVTTAALAARQLGTASAQPDDTTRPPLRFYPLFLSLSQSPP
jgi:hypothetical protein